MRLSLPLGAPAPPPIDDPIRAELFGIERLEQHAETLAAAQGVRGEGEAGHPLLARVEDNGRVLRETNRAIAAALKEKRWITPAAEWLIDNFFVVDEQLSEIYDDLPEGYYHELPKLVEGPLAGYPRVYGIAWAYVAHTDSRFDPDMLRRFVQAYQRVQPLTIGELWAVPITLRVVLVENLRRMADAITRRRKAQQEADALAEDLLAQGGRSLQALTSMLARDERSRLVTAFAVELVQRLRGQDPAVTPALTWLHQRLAAQGTTPDEITLVEHQREAATTVTVRNIITSMRLLTALDWTAFFESVSLVDAALRVEPGFAAMDFASRDSYRHAIEQLARGSRRAELDITREALAHAAQAGPAAPGEAPQADARHADPGYYLIGAGRRAFERAVGFRPSLKLRLLRAFVDLATPGYLGTILVFTAVILALPLLAAWHAGLSRTGLIVLGALALVPASELGIALLNRAVTFIVTPGLLPRFEWPGGVPAEYRTLVAIPALLSGRADVDQLVERLEVHYLANPEGDVRFALLSDWSDAATEHAPGDDEILSAVREGVARLNERHGPVTGGGDRFLVFHRPRLWNPSEGVWMGWERKRGKLHELNRLLREAHDTTFLSSDAPVPTGVRYVVTLDADTRIPNGAVKRLAGTMAHPLNRPRFDPAEQRVVEGYAVLQPRVSAPLPGETGSLFQRLVSGSPGIDPYAAAVSDVYQDLFGEGSYTGKGIYDVDAFEAALAGRVPENALLSHDLFEGLFARAGLVTDVTLFESAPANYLTNAGRQHRWARGDWQLLPWILHQRMSPVARWKMIDNLRRSVAMPALFLTIVAGVAWPGSPAVAWAAFALTVLLVPPLLPVVARIPSRSPGVSKVRHAKTLARDFRLALAQVGLTLAMVPQQAWLMFDAVARTLGRMYLTHRRMLEWKTMARAASGAPTTVPGFYRSMVGGLLLALAGAIAIEVTRPGALPAWWPLFALWGVSPAIAHWVSVPGLAARQVPLSPDGARALRLIARRTWRFFSTFVTAEGHWLPPDNFQESPNPVVAHRTSPTNIGLYLLSAVSARDFGWIGTHDLVDRLEATLHAVQGLDHHRGHLYNWYDTASGRPLEPQYVSSVDSGNVAGALLTLANACEELLGQPVPSVVGLTGIEDTARLLRESAHAGGREAGATPAKLRRLDEATDVLMTVLAAQPAAPGDWARRMAELDSATRAAADCARDVGADLAEDARAEVLDWAEELRAAVATHAHDLDALKQWTRLPAIEAAVPALARLTSMMPLADLPQACAAASHDLAAVRAGLDQADRAGQRGVDALVASLDRSATAAAALVQRLRQLADLARSMAAAMDFAFLFDRTRQLFAIGYRMTDGTLDPGRYDLLGSEARLLSFVAIAKGDVPVKHWFRLGRPLTLVHRDTALLSWSGSMFEYLMPRLIMVSPVGSLLEQSCRLVVRSQIGYGEERGVPWGISESGYNARDLQMTYQYSAFGVPGLGLKRGLADDLVIAPYASGLATMVDPMAALRNLQALAAAGAAGRFGFYESVDYTTSRLPEGTTRAVVQMYMAHHQGMLVVAIANALHGGVMRNRFHAEPMVRASELLLQERPPRDVAVVRPQVDPAAAAGDVRALVPLQTRNVTTPHSGTPRTQLLSNGRYAVMLTAAGAGYSRWGRLAVTRWREDVTRDDAGAYVYLRDAGNGERWSAAYHACGREADEYAVAFSEDRAEIQRRDGDLSTRYEVIVSSEDDAELRRVSITNHGVRTREIEATSYAEIVLAPPAADAAHPAFSNLFVQTESVPDRSMLLATRRPRSPEDAEVWLAHVLAVEGETVGDLQWETDRAQFLGRGGNLQAPQVEVGGRPLSNTTGPVLDPIVSLRRRVRIRPGRTVRLTFSTLVCSSRDAALDLADKYHDVTIFERAATMAWTQAQVQLRHLGIGPDEAHLFQDLAGSVLYADRTRRAPAPVLMRPVEGVGALWAHGISGDLPIVMVEIDAAEDIDIVRQLLRAHEYWAMKGLAVDLVIVNDRAPSYVQELQVLLETLVRASQARPRNSEQKSRGNLFVLRAEQLTSGQRDALEGAARVTLSCRRGTLATQVTRTQRSDTAEVTPRARRPAAPSVASVATPAAGGLEFGNGFGGFAADGREYRVVLRPGQWTPAPWINVLANPAFGCLVSEAGAGCTWSINSQSNRLTPWSNDPVSDPPSEVLFVRDEESGELWTPTPLPIRDPAGEYVVRHGQGWTRFDFASRGVGLQLIQFVAAEDPVKVSHLTITNPSSRPRRLTVTGYLEWVLGATREASAPFVITERDPDTKAMFAHNAWNRDFAGRIAFADLRGAQTAWTGDRTEFLGRNGALDAPAALAGKEALSGTCGAGFDPCCALQASVTVPPGGQIEVTFLLGEAGTREEARALVQRYRTADLGAQLKQVTDRWDDLLGAVQVKTPDRALDIMLNGWLPYQVVACRLWGRTAFYQSSGAYGFRDQLQDVLAVTASRPDLARAQLLRAAARQFSEGDVQHWWHEPSGRGVRTRISDDLLWLPYVAARYREVTGDAAILDEAVPFLEGPALADGQTESFFEPRASDQPAALFEHCARAIDRSLAVGAHGLPLMGTGDWNDGMNLVGAGGKGESVWLAWFLVTVLNEWAPIAQARGDGKRAKAWKRQAGLLQAAIEREAWDGNWYRRAWFDDGTPLGSASNDACAIDAIAQSWSVLSGAAPPDRARQAMASVDARLVRREDDLILLLAPPFDHTSLQPGYIKGYLPGVRENGGQYTHAATWVVMAFAALGDGAKVAELLAMLNPINHSATPQGALQYQIEPYVVAGDVYSELPHVGRGGWSWYTGSAGWLYRAGLEALLGFRLKGDKLVIDPCIPPTWTGYTLTFRRQATRYDITVENPRGAGRGVTTIECDGAACDPTTGIPLARDGQTHRVRVVLG